MARAGRRERCTTRVPSSPACKLQTFPPTGRSQARCPGPPSSSWPTAWCAWRAGAQSECQGVGVCVCVGFCICLDTSGVPGWAGSRRPPGQCKASPGCAPRRTHTQGAQRDFGLHTTADVFARAGFGVLVFDYRTFGASDGEPRHWVSPARHLEDWRAAIQWANVRPDGFTGAWLALALLGGVLRAAQKGLSLVGA